MSRADGNGSSTGTPDVFSSLRFIPCQVEPGMFNGEWLVFLDAIDPNNPDRKIVAKLLVDSRDVSGIKGRPERHKPKSAWLRVEVGKKMKGVVQLILPQPAIPTGECVFMAEDQVQQKVS